ncbi:hypothetical protein GCM10009850_120490 [Nonomuraea monospora]|uniref:TetR family transcriptional regulator n=1 Tax=Nonomuraea monospora TaxID=568818 RepID=A0ABN3D4G8_9ACTN
MLPESTRRAVPRPGPEPRLSREKIVKAAVELGIEQVSIGAVAAAPASLYCYIDSLDDLVAAAVETVLAATPLPSPERGWRAYLEEEAGIRLHLLTRYAGLVPEGAAGLAGVAGRRFEQLVQGLVGLGFPVEEAVLAVVGAPREHLARKLGLVLDGIAARHTTASP